MFLATPHTTTRRLGPDRPRSDPAMRPPVLVNAGGVLDQQRQAAGGPPRADIRPRVSDHPARGQGGCGEWTLSSSMPGAGLPHVYGQVIPAGVPSVVQAWARGIKGHSPRARATRRGEARNWTRPIRLGGSSRARGRSLAAVCATRDARRATSTAALACVASHPRIDRVGGF
jgi:hypothetical protein